MIKAIVFDFGNVLYNLNEKLFKDNLSVLLDENLSEGYPKHLLDASYQYEIGKINTETFIWKIQHYKKGNLNPRSIINCWNSLLDHFPPHRWDFLDKLKDRYKLFLLSNINELHLDTVYKHIHKVHGQIDFETNYFDGVFYSHLLKMRKPDKEIYDFVEQMTGLNGRELLFIDDKMENVEAARLNGWNAIVHDPNNDIAVEFEGYLSSVLL